MNFYKKLTLLTTFFMLLANVHAESITASALTLNEAENIIAIQAHAKKSEYKITGAHYGNHVHMSAILTTNLSTNEPENTKAAPSDTKY